jgi:NAD(P)-dependent dehydrogenase (short-subunit alcohol dehydrogenase family)
MGAMATYDLSGKVALVTGGARGIGFATAQALSDRGASVVIVDLDAASAEAAAARLHDSRALGLAADVTDRAAMQRAVATTVERFGGLDVVVANAGIASRGATFRATSTETFDRVIDVNLMGVVRTVEAALPQIVARQGHVVVVASVYAFINGMGAVPYAMAKAGVEQLGRALRVELAPFGASATTAYFGFIDTEMVHKALDQDPLSDALMAVVPKPLRKRLPPKVAGEAIVAGIEKRAARVIRPRRWTGLSVIRGAINPITDRIMERNAETHDLVRQFDAREGEEQPTTA